MSQFIKDTKISEKKYKNVHNLQDKPGCKKYVSVTTVTKLMPANLSILITTKFKNQNLSKPKNKVFKKLGSFHFFVTFCMPWELSHLTSKDFLFAFLFQCLSASEKNQNGTCIFLLEIHLIKQSRDLNGYDY